MLPSRPSQAPQFKVDFKEPYFALTGLKVFRSELKSGLCETITNPTKLRSLRALNLLTSKDAKISALNIKTTLPSSFPSIDDLTPALFIFDNLKLRIQGSSVTRLGATTLFKSKQTGHLRSVLAFSKSPLYGVIPLFKSRYFFTSTLNTESHPFFSNRPRSWSLEAKVSNPSKLFEVIASHGSKRLSLLDSSTSMRDFSRGIYWVIKSERLPYVASFKHYPSARYSSYKLNFNDLPSSTKDEFSSTQKVLYEGKQFLNIPDTVFLNQQFTDSSSRLLRVKQFLVLPVSINMTAITTSTDIMHSWFIPNLGLKLDCVPGKMTHHTFIFNIPGVYYGQCAEICGRQHHHMPIKLVLVDWIHFMIYTNHFIYRQWEEVSKNLNYGFERNLFLREVVAEKLEFSYPSVYNRSFINKDILFDYNALCSYRSANKSY